MGSKLSIQARMSKLLRKTINDRNIQGKANFNRQTPIHQRNPNHQGPHFRRDGCYLKFHRRCRELDRKMFYY